ncbi:MAG: sulfotransferase [Chloroflexi bacterium]|nr:sulfotransferase [Chloroflexota bacterium]
MAHPPILVTGSHRSGTTWVGKMLAAAGAHAYVSEPLNRWHRPGVMAASVNHWYAYICEENEAAFLPAFRQTLALRYGLGRELRSLRSPKDVGRMLRDVSIFGRGRLTGQAALLKDPFAAFSAPWFAGRLGCRAVLVVRHPAAFASSLKRLEWSFNFNDLLEQPLLMRDWLEPHRTQMLAAKDSRDNLLRACLLWRMIYDAFQQMRQRHPGLVIVRHEDLSRGPLEAFRTLYAALELAFTPRVERRVLRSSRVENPGEVSRRNIYNVNLDSRANLKNWQQRLTDDEIARVRTLTADVAGHFYTDADWE